jgi:hypothetical protein
LSSSRLRLARWRRLLSRGLEGKDEEEEEEEEEEEHGEEMKRGSQ